MKIFDEYDMGVIVTTLVFLVISAIIPIEWEYCLLFLVSYLAFHLFFLIWGMIIVILETSKKLRKLELISRKGFERKINGV